MWRPGLELELVNIKMNAILVLIYFGPSYLSWLIIYVYAIAQHFKATFWKCLDSTNQAFPAPWCYIEDFNDLLNESKNLMGTLSPPNR